LITILSCDDPQSNDWIPTLVQFRAANPEFIVYYPNQAVFENEGDVLRREQLFDWSVDLIRDDLLCIVSV